MTPLPAIIFNKINMLGTTDFEFLRTFRGDKVLRAIPVIVISAKVDRVAIRHGMAVV